MRFRITIYMQISKSVCSSHCDLLIVQMGWIGFVVELSGFPPSCAFLFRYNGIQLYLQNLVQ